MIIRVNKEEDSFIENQMPTLMPEVLSHVWTYLEQRELFNLVFLHRKVIKMLAIEIVMKSTTQEM